MATDLQETLSRLTHKSSVLVEKYKHLQSEKQRLEEENEQLRLNIDVLKRRNERLEQDNDYLSMARSIAPDREKLDATRAMIAKLVQDIDTSIAQLSE